MSRFKSLVSGLTESSPQIKGTLESWGKELNELRANPVGNERRMQELSDNIKSTVEANAKRVPTPAVAKAQDKAAAFAPMMQSPFANGNPQEQLERGVAQTGKNLVNRFMTDSSPEDKALAEKTFSAVANPMNLVGGVGLLDAAMTGVEVAPEAYEAAKARFKGLFGN